MKATAIAPVLAILLARPAPAPAVAAESPATSPTPAPKTAPRVHRKLNLGPFADPYARVDDEALAELLRFYQHIEVEGKAPQDLQAAMQAWWDHFNFQHSVYGRGYNVQKPMANGAINILPLIDWLRKRVKTDRRNKMLPAEDDEGEEQE
jgi:hypothetical protein